MNIILSGKFTDIFPAEIYGNFEKRVAWLLETDTQYPNHYSLEFLQADANILDNYQPGDLVKCHIDVRGRKYDKNGKSGVINTLKCWKVERIGAAAKPAPSTRQQTGGIPPAKPVEPTDDLPF